MVIRAEFFELIVKLLAIQTSSIIQTRKEELLKSDKGISAYSTCDGLSTMAEMAEKRTASKRFLENNLPVWEEKGLIISVGFGKGKRYLSIENIAKYLATLSGGQ